MSKLFTGGGGEKKEEGNVETAVVSSVRDSAEAPSVDSPEVCRLLFCDYYDLLCMPSAQQCRFGLLKQDLANSIRIRIFKEICDLFFSVLV